MNDWITWEKIGGENSAHKVRFTTEISARTRCGLNVNVNLVQGAGLNQRKCAVCVARSTFVAGVRG